MGQCRCVIAFLNGNDAANGPDAMGATSLGFNLITSTNGMAALQATDLCNVPGGINSLGQNGGSTLTHVLLPGSPAINAGDDTLVGIEQRGYPRKAGPRVDIGAVEFTYPSPQNLRVHKPSNGIPQFTLVSVGDVPFSVWATTNIATPMAQWVNLGSATLISNGVYEFTDSAVSNNKRRFLRLRVP